MSEVQALREFFDEIHRAPRFRTRPASIPGDFRVAWRLSVLTLLLQRGRANTLSLEHLHVLWWAIRSREARELLLRWFIGVQRPDELIVRFDPSLTATLDLALGAGLVTRTSSGNVKLTPSGLLLAREALLEPAVLADEKQFLQELPRNITQREIRDILEWA